MAARVSPLTAKAWAADKREFKRKFDPPRHLAVSTAQANERQFDDNGDPKFWVPSSVRYKLELEYRARLAAEGRHDALAMREDLLPLQAAPSRSPWAAPVRDPNLERFRPLSKRQRRMLGL